MENLPQGLNRFLIRAKRAAYASGRAEDEITGDGRREFAYAEDGGWLYADSYVGGRQFAGREIVRKDGVPIWAMNYAGRVLGEGFSGAVLKEALLRVPADAPYRGPIEYQDGPHLYCNTCAGDMRWFFGREEIYKSGVSVFECVYHGGAIL